MSPDGELLAVPADTAWPEYLENPFPAASTENHFPPTPSRRSPAAFPPSFYLSHSILPKPLSTIVTFDLYIPILYNMVSIHPKETRYHNDCNS